MIQQIWLLVFAGHAACAAAWWWLMPGGFPSSLREYWMNQVLPFVPVAILVAALAARGALAASLLPALQAMFPLFWMAAAISARLTFPTSSGALWNLAFAGGFALAMLWERQHRFRVPQAWLLPAFLIPALWAGWAFPPSQRALDAATVPSKEPLFELPPNARRPELIKLSKDAQLHPADGRLVIRRQQLVLTVQPLLSFADRSPDRATIALAPPEDNHPTRRKLLSTLREGARWKLSYEDEDHSVLDVGLREAAIELEARSRLPAEIFSHLNQLAEITMQGHRKLSVTFSPIPGRRIEIPSQAEPARFAYLDEAGIFHVVQAEHHRLGPYTELAAGPLEREAPITLTLFDGEGVAFRITLADWARQASTQLSPAAGHGVPVNSIELSRVGEADSAPVSISCSLASTALGRGAQTVGHTAGVYRNRISINTAPATTP